MPIKLFASTLESIQIKLPCNFSYVIPDNKIRINSIEHSGVVTHKCSLEKEHKPPCKCLCGQTFLGWN